MFGGLHPKWCEAPPRCERLCSFQIFPPNIAVSLMKNTAIVFSRYFISIFLRSHFPEHFGSTFDWREHVQSRANQQHLRAQTRYFIPVKHYHPLLGHYYPFSLTVFPQVPDWTMITLHQEYEIWTPPMWTPLSLSRLGLVHAWVLLFGGGRLITLWLWLT